MPRVLLVDDEPSIRHLFGLNLRAAGYEVVEAENGKVALARLLNAHGEGRGDIDVILSDIRMPELDGPGLLQALPPGSPPVIMMSAYGDKDTALEAIRRGAYDYVDKSVKRDELVLTLKKLEERETLLRDRASLAVENAQLQAGLQGGDHAGDQGLIGSAPAMVDLLRVLRRVAPHPTTVLITGESGTGKEVFARALHRLSPRRDQAFIPVNCAAIPEGLIESELFGHERGAFTGATAARAGLLEQADGGTLLLDEIGDLPAPLQAKLLRVLEDGVVRRLGARAERKVDVRIVAATAQPLSPPAFREDLYYRLAVVHLRLPPLRQRSEDIPALVDHLLTHLSHRLGLPRPSLSPEAREKLLRAEWPGNIRQLENVLQRALLVSEGSVILPEDLSLTPPGGDTPGTNGADDLSIPRHTEVLERRLITAALAACNGNRSAAAKRLEIAYKTLLYKIQDYGIG